MAGRPGTSGVDWITQQMSDMLKVRAVRQRLSLHLAVLWHLEVYSFADMAQLSVDNVDCSHSTQYNHIFSSYLCHL